MAAANDSYRADIDGLRAVAVLAVVAFHAFPSFAPGGFVGVDVFFVISGYLISGIILDSARKDCFDLRDFYRRRVRRIFPALVTVLGASYAAGWFLLTPLEYRSLGKHIAGGVGFVANFVYWNESGYFDALPEAKPLLHLWSLGVEEQFYLIWPAVVLIALRWKSGLLAATLGISLVSFVVNVLGVRDYPDATYFLPMSRLWELLLGALIAQSSLERMRWFSNGGQILRGGISLLGFVMVLAAVLIVTRESPFPGWLALLPTIGTALIILATKEAWLNRTVLSVRPLVLVGLISYPLYLWHWPLLSFMRILGSGYSGRIERIGLVAASFVLAYATYVFIERPIRTGRWKSRAAPVLAMAACVIGIAGLSTFFAGGNPGRYSLHENAQVLIDSIKKNLAALDRDWYFQHGTCLLSGAQKQFSEACTDADKTALAGPRLLLWGDSTAAQYFHAIKDFPANRFSVGLLASSSCPPVWNFALKARPLCQQLNDQARERIEKFKPDVVFLVHDWEQSVAEGSLDRLPETVSQLRAMGAKQIYLVGEGPHWGASLPDILEREALITGNVPGRIRPRLYPDTVQVNGRLKAVATALGLEYVSPADFLCDDQGCITYVDGPAGTVATSIDTLHLSPEASGMFIESIRNSLFGPN